MFTGIVEELGKVQRITRGGMKQRITIGCSKVLLDVHKGDSIAVNGVCLTVVEHNRNSFTADVMNETFNRSSLGKLYAGSPVNLERAMAADGRFGGHIVSGHIDGTGTIKSVRLDGNAYWFEIAAEEKLLAGVVEKGSIAIDGISLTVAAVDRRSFKVSIIPHTLHETVLGSRRTGDIVNLETDVVGKYIQNLLEEESRGLTKEFLIANGF